MLPPRHTLVRPSPVERLVTNTALSRSSETGDLHQNDQEQLRLWRHPSFSLSLPLKPSFEMLVTHQVSGRPGVVNLLSFEMLMRLIRKSMSMFQTFALACLRPLRMIRMAPYSIISSSSTGALCAMDSPSKGSSDNGGHNFYPGILVPIRPIAIIKKGDKQ